MPRLLALTAAALLATAGTAPAHAPARLDVVSPAEGARVAGDPLRVVVRGVGGSAAAAFRLDLDGRGVDATGRVGGVFGTLSVEPGKELTLEVAVEPGEHTLTAVPKADPHTRQVTVVRRFTVVAPEPTDAPGAGGNGLGAVPLAAAGVALAAVLGAAVVAGRKRLA